MALLLSSDQTSVSNCWIVEPLEARALLSAVYPTDIEQYLVELVNRARLNPSAEAARWGTALNEGLPANTISTAPKQALAINPYITDAARTHSQWMLDNDIFSHTGAGGSNPGQRLQAAGYNLIAPYVWGENIAWRGLNPSVPDPEATTLYLHKNLYIDTTEADRGHRTNMFTADFKEIGPAVLSGNFQGYNAVMLATDFGVVGTGSFLTGVAYTDTDGDAFYSPGEGYGGVTITAKRLSDNATFSTTTFSTGGYSLKLSAGTYAISGGGGALGALADYGSVTVGTENIKKDFLPGTGVSATPPSAHASFANVFKGGSNSYTFTVIYSDQTAINLSTIDSLDVVISDTKGWTTTAALLKTDATGNAATIKATYNIKPPGNWWDPSDLGTYTVSLNANAVRNTGGAAVAAKTLGTFRANVPTLPTAKLAAKIPKAGWSSMVFSVTYSGPRPIDVSTIDVKDLKVTDSSGSWLEVRVVSVNRSTDGTPRTVVYRAMAPGGTWDAGDNGKYNFTMNTAQVGDTARNYVAPKKLGAITIALGVAAPAARKTPFATTSLHRGAEDLLYSPAEYVLEA